MLDGMDKEHRTTSVKSSWKGVCVPSNRHRILLAISLQAAQQYTGNTSLAYFAPQIFATIGAGDNSVFITGLYGIVKIIGVILFMTLVIGRTGRKTIFLLGASAMGTLMLAVGALAAFHSPRDYESIDAYGLAAISMVYMEAITFNLS